LQSTTGADRRLDSFIANIQQLLPAKAASGPGQSSVEYSARELTEKLALALQASLVMRHSSSAMAEAFIASRLSGRHGQAFGTLPSGVDINGILGSSAELLQ
jgi:putative acyl-CoA dehydrogenase